MRSARWISHLQSSAHVHRFLARIGAGIAPALGDSISPEKLHSYVDRLINTDVDAQVLMEVIELMTGGYAEFLDRELPTLLSVLSNETTSRVDIVGPSVRGVVRWDLTKVGRANRSLPFSRYVSNIPDRSYATAPNLLLVWLLHDIGRGVHLVAGKVGSARLHPILRAIKERVVRALQSEELALVDRPPQVLPSMLRLARNSRSSGYRTVASLADRRRRIGSRSEGARWNILLQLLQRNWLQPTHDDDLCELFVLSEVISVLAEDLGFGEPLHYGLLGSQVEPAAILQKDQVRVSVYFDRAPTSVIGGEYRYRQLASRYEGVDARERRPDVLVVVENAENARRLLFIEVKNTSSSGYVRDSIYKVFGYLHDYADAFSSDQDVRAILWVPHEAGVTRSEVADEAGAGFARIIPEGNRAHLADAIRNLCT